MSLKDLDIKITYISKGDDNISQNLVIPALSESKYYKRSVGFFSSGVLDIILDGIVKLVRNDGEIKIIASPKLSQEDIDAISIGYAKKNKLQCLQDKFFEEFDIAINSLNNEKLNILIDLISNNILDIKIAESLGNGDYHDKLGIFEDVNGNKVVFVGSANESKNGYYDNYEKIRVFKSWDDTKRYAEDEEKEFDNLWNGTNEFVKTHSFHSALQEHILKIREKRQNEQNLCNKNEPIELRDYQKRAISKWVENQYKGFYVMATGTGKTWTAIFSLKELFKIENVFTVICAPYKHLILQWKDDVCKLFPDAKIIMVSSENSSWENELTSAIIEKKYNPKTVIIVVSTIASFNSERFTKCVCKDKSNKILIVDEAHRFTKRDESLKTIYKYMLGLSATPVSGRNVEKGKLLMDFFGGRVFNLPIETALKQKYLVPYNYYPIFVYFTQEEEKIFQELSAKMASCFKNGICCDSERFVKYHRNRLRLISMAQEKINQIDCFISQINTNNHFIIYCGDGRLYNDDSNNTVRHINYVKSKLSQHGYKSSQFTASENMKERMNLVDLFNMGAIDALAAIRCLDEGINIPSIRTALILSSNDDYREFVQRRGRILRKFIDANGIKKEEANIFDVIVLPNDIKSGVAKIEFRRFYEYARLAKNKDYLIRILEDYMDKYHLEYEDITNEDIEGIDEDLLYE